MTDEQWLQVFDGVLTELFSEAGVDPLSPRVQAIMRRARRDLLAGMRELREVNDEGDG